MVSIDLSSPDEILSHTPTQPWVSDTDSEPGSPVQATIETVERKTSVLSRPRLVERPSLAVDTSTSAISRGRGLDNPSVRNMNTSALRQYSPNSTLVVTPPPAIYTREATTPPWTPSTKRVVGLPSRPSPSANWRTGDVLGKRVPM